MRNIHKRKSFLTAAIGLGALLSCTAAIEPNPPPETVMHFPSVLKMNKNYLFAISSSTDEKYDHGRMVSLNTAAIKSAISRGDNSYPISWPQVVTANVMVPIDIGSVAISGDRLALVARSENRLTVVPLKDDNLSCNDPQIDVSACPGAHTLKLSQNDPHSIASLDKRSSAAMFLLSYLSSDQIDVVALDQGDKAGLAVTNSFKAMKFLDGLVDKDQLKDRRAITKKVFITKKGDVEKAYLLIELHPHNSEDLARAKGAFLLAIDTDYLTKKSDNPQIKLWNLHKNFAINAAQDFYIDEDASEAIVLSKVPESLLKISLDDNGLIESKAICTGATSMAVAQGDDMLAIPCFKDSRVATFFISSLTSALTSKNIGRGPTTVEIDDDFVYVALSLDGVIKVLDKKTLEVKAHIFNKAPSGRIGS